MKRFRQILESVDPIMEAIAASAKELAKEIDAAARRETGQDKKDYMNVAKLIAANKYKEAAKFMSKLDTMPLEDLVVLIMGHEDVFKVMYPKARPGQFVANFARESTIDEGKYQKYSDLLIKKAKLVAQGPIASKEVADINKQIAAEMKNLGVKEAVEAEAINLDTVYSDISEAFMRIPKSVRGNDLVALNRNFDAMYNSLSNGGDWKPEVYKSLVKQMTAISKSAKSFNSKDDMSSMYEEVEFDEAFTPKDVKMAIGVASDKRYAGGNMTGAVNAIEKIKKGLSDHPQVKAVLKKQNESDELEEAMSPADKAKRLKMIRLAVEKINKNNAELAKKDALRMMKDSGMFDD